MDDDTPWIPACLLGKSVDEAKAHVCGYIESKEDLDIVLEAHKRASLSSFVTWSDDIKRKQKAERRLLWKYQDISSNTPFVVERSVVMLCQFGNPREQKDVPVPDDDGLTTTMGTKDEDLTFRPPKKLDARPKSQ